MIARSLARRTVAATLLTAALSSIVLAAASALALKLLWRRHDLQGLEQTADTVARALSVELGEDEHGPDGAAKEALLQSLSPADRGVIRSGEAVLAAVGDLPPAGTGGALAPGWIEARREVPGGYFIEVVRRPADGLPLRRLFWAALLVAALPSVLVAVVVGGWAGRAAARPVEELAKRLGRVRDPRDYVPAPTEGLGTEAAVLERAFAEVLARLGGALDREEEFARNAAHELRTPLTRMRLRAERAAAGASGDCRRELEALTSEIDRLSRLADALLVLARDESAGLGADETVNLADLVRSSAGGGDRAVDVWAPDEALVRGDEDLLRLAVENLLENARKYAPAGLTPAARIRANGPDVTLSVETPGVTLDAAERARVFDRFYRGAAAREAAPGHGLGLALARHVARFHGGDVVAADGGDAKTVFVLSLPAWRSGAWPSGGTDRAAQPPR